MLIATKDIFRLQNEDRMELAQAQAVSCLQKKVFSKTLETVKAALSSINGGDSSPSRRTRNIATSPAKRTASTSPSKRGRQNLGSASPSKRPRTHDEDIPSAFMKFAPINPVNPAPVPSSTPNHPAPDLAVGDPMFLDELTTTHVSENEESLSCYRRPGRYRPIFADHVSWTLADQKITKIWKTARKHVLEMEGLYGNPLDDSRDVMNED
jgi:hypothetical protein